MFEHHPKHTLQRGAEGAAGDASPNSPVRAAHQLGGHFHGYKTGGDSAGGQCGAWTFGDFGIEIAVPAARFDEIAAALPGWEWDVGDGRIWPYPEQWEKHFQTWLREPATGTYRLDVFREPHIGERWVCRRDPAITVSFTELILRTGDGIPYVSLEVALLFKAKHQRAKDEADFLRVLPELGAVRRSRLRAWLSRVHPGHGWIDGLRRARCCVRARE
jgi:hypothetical protein